MARTSLGEGKGLRFRLFALAKAASIKLLSAPESQRKKYHVTIVMTSIRINSTQLYL